MERNPANHLGCSKTLQIMEYLPYRLVATEYVIFFPGGSHQPRANNLAFITGFDAAKGTTNMEPSCARFEGSVFGTRNLRLGSFTKKKLSRSFSQRVSLPLKKWCEWKTILSFLGRKTQFQGFFLNFRRCIEQEKDLLKDDKNPSPQKKTSSTPFPKTTSAEKMGFTRYIRVYQITCFFLSGNYCSPFSGGFR